MNDLTKGKPLKLIFWFTIPLLIGNIFQQFYSLSDTLIVGQTLGVKALAAVGSTGSVQFLIIGFAQGLTAGLSILTAQHYGAKDFKGVRRSFAISIIVSLVVGIILTIVSLIFVDHILVLMQTPTDIIDDARTFLQIMLGGMLAPIAFNLLSNIIRALGDSRTPLWFLIISSLINIGLELLFILGFHWGIAGAGWATILAQLLASVMCVVYIVVRVPILHIGRRHFKLRRAEVTSHLRVGLPMAFQMSIIAIGTIVLQAALNSLGTDSVAATTAAQKIDQLATQPLMSFGVTMATFAAQNFGAHQYGRIITGVKQTMWLSGAFSVAAGVIEIIWGQQLVGLFVGHQDMAVLHLSQTYFNIIGSSYILLSMLFIMRNTLQGLGRSAIPTLAGAAELFMRVFAALILVRFFAYPGACFSEPLAWLGSVAVLLPAYIRAVHELRQRMATDKTNKAVDSTVSVTE
ncbi:MATE family efflux transporter [Lactiplantibacillus mudanjiangensis]|uniref:MATE family efflux transporter [Lactobacillus sp.] n=1 Tax=Lactiplantibacillus mudanjiangensis TaxID=1296538 RepID=A0A660E4J0_9LACO|nr:MATE family efflux transporter [Lactiplantibacillus mudanjiangensis]VDG25062.1 MATE family efflux transporter [Lactobacillus sp.] [Lactiplantibacillus mudanjiangensis]VDG29663.1 MATE family efflux transporter [Lactobacillus sp.] [Lactiplantibacillus mudanjiangensis]VDG33668.1 MATE family efflux transporter [Lactobacillus sp.] [Lactiplantibacillus mudanjiangensis]